MPGFLPRTALLIMLLMIGAASALPEAPKGPTWLVQISFPAIAKHSELAPDAYSGRVEVYQEGQFVGCAWAAVFDASPGHRRLAPMNLGYTATGSKDTIHVEAFGELERLGGMTVRITELNAASATEAPAAK